MVVNERVETEKGTKITEPGRPRPATAPVPSLADKEESLVTAACRRMTATRGRARQAHRVFEQCKVPMGLVDNNRRFLEANPAARLLLRMGRTELRRRRIDDFTPLWRLPALEAEWREFLAGGSAAGQFDILLRDGSPLSIVYCRLANLLPGRHLTVFAPSDWHEDGADALDVTSVDTVSASALSPREREVLSFVAAGADLQEIADELTLSPATVRTHLGNARRKLGARNRTHAVALAMQQGLTEVLMPGTGTERDDSI